jgi:hypothetical protein
MTIFCWLSILSVGFAFWAKFEPIFLLFFSGSPSCWTEPKPIWLGPIYFISRFNGILKMTDNAFVTMVTRSYKILCFLVTVGKIRSLLSVLSIFFVTTTRIDFGEACFFYKTITLIFLLISYCIT